MLATLLLDSRGLLTLSPMLIMGAIGTVLLYRRGRRAEALTIGGICLCYLVYNSGYYLPFGGGFMGPRFLDTMLPFLAFPIALALKRFPGPTIALAAVSITTTVIATITHPLVGYENETVTWMRYLRQGPLPADDRLRLRPRARLGRDLAVLPGCGRRPSCWPCGRPHACACPRRRSLRGCSRCVGWGLFATLAPTVLGIDHAGLASIYGAGDHTAFNLPLHSGSSYPLETLAPIAVARRPAGPRRDATGAQPANGALAPARGRRRRHLADAAGAQRVISS